MKTLDITPTMNTTRLAPLNLKSKLSILCAVFAAVTMSHGLRAADIYWETGSSGNWNTPGNWTGGVLPANTDSVIFKSGSVTLDTTATTAITSIGHAAGDHTVMEISGIWKNTDNFTVGNAGLGEVTILTGGTLESNGNRFYVGATGTGVLVIEEGAALLQKNAGTGNQDDFYIGGTLAALNAGGALAGSGTVIVDGLLDVNRYIRVGSGGDGYLYVGQTGTVNALGLRNTYYNWKSTGTVIIDGVWNSTGYIIVSHYGDSYFELGQTGTANVGGYFNVGQADGTGNPYTNTGTAIIKGTMNVVGALQIANRMNATVDITRSGTVNIGSTFYVGGAATGKGILNLDGVLQVAGGATGATVYSNIGDYGRGVFNITNTGTAIITTRTRLGYRASSYGELNVAGYWDGAGNGSAQLYVGVSGTGSIYVAPTGSFIAANGVYLADQASGHANVTVAGYWENKSGLIYTGIRGTGTFTITETGTVKGANSFRVAGAGDSNNDTGDSYVFVHGVLNNGNGANTIGVGYAGQGRMTVFSTGTVIAGDTYVGDRIGGTGTLTLLSGARWLTSENIFYVGSSGKGVLIIEEGAAIVANPLQTPLLGNFVVGNNATGSGTATIAGTISSALSLINGNHVNATGHFEAKSTSSITFGGGFSQNARSTLAVQTGTSRPRDPSNILIYTPLLSFGGRATLSGTLHAYGDAIPGLEYTGNGEGKASELSGIPVLRAAGGIMGEFDEVAIDGLVIPLGLPDFILDGGIKVNEGGALPTRYDIGFGLAWNSNPKNAGTWGTFTIEEGKTFEVDVQLSNRASDLVFASGWDGKSLTKKGEGTLVISALNTYNGATTVQSGTLMYAGPPSHTLGALINNSVIDFGGEGIRTLSATSLLGSGTFNMTLNLNAGTSDRLTITGDAIGNYHFNITDIGSGEMPTGDEPMITLFSIGGVNDITPSTNIVIGGNRVDGNFEYGVFKYAVEMQGNNLVIDNKGLKEEIHNIIDGVLGAQNLMWFDQVDNVSRRFGELRAPRGEDGLGLDFWARAHAASAEIGGGDSNTRRSDNDLWGAEIGVDYTWLLDSERATLGAYIGFGSISQDFHNVATAGAADGDSDLIGFGVYGAWLTDSGWFVNATLSAAHYKNKFTASNTTGDTRIRGDYKDRAFGVTAEAGRRFTIPKNWFVEPAVQGAIVRLTRGNHTTEGVPLSVRGADATVSRVRGALRFGRNWTFENGGWLEIAARGGAVHERSTGGEINIGSATRWRPNLDGDRFEAGFGVYWQPFEKGQLYFDYEYANGDNFEKPWAVSLGFRLSL